MPFWLANSVGPPAMEIACSTLMLRSSVTGPGVPTRPRTYTTRLLISVTVTVTVGTWTKSRNSEVISASSSAAVLPAAASSPTSGSEM